MKEIWSLGKRRQFQDKTTSERLMLTVGELEKNGPSPGQKPTAGLSSIPAEVLHPSQQHQFQLRHPFYRNSHVEQVF